MKQPSPEELLEAFTQLGALALHLAAVVPSEAANEHASMEWRALRVSWLRALLILGLTEEQARIHQRQVFSEALAFARADEASAGHA